MIYFFCPCGEQIRAHDEDRGASIRCPSCGCARVVPDLIPNVRRLPAPSGPNGGPEGPPTTPDAGAPGVAPLYVIKEVPVLRPPVSEPSQASARRRPSGEVLDALPCDVESETPRRRRTACLTCGAAMGNGEAFCPRCGRRAGSPTPAATPSVRRPGARSQPARVGTPEASGWSPGAILGLTLAAILLCPPFGGLVLGLVGLLSPGKRGQGVWLVLVGVCSCYLAVVSANGYFAEVERKYREEEKRQAQRAHAEAQKHFYAGWEADDKKDYDLALAHYDKAIQAEPGNVGAYYGRAWCYYHKEKYQEAIAAFDQALVWAKEGDTYYVTPKVDHHFTKALVYSSRGMVYYARGEYETAIRDCSEAIRLDDKLAHAYYWRGWAYDKQGKPEEARKDKKRAAELDPKLKD